MFRSARSSHGSSRLPHGPRPVRRQGWLAVFLLPTSLALLACSGIGGDLVGAGDTGGEPLVVPTEVVEGSGDGAADGGLERPDVVKRPDLKERIDRAGKRPRRSPDKAEVPEEEEKDEVPVVEDPEKPAPGPAEPEGIKGVKQLTSRSWSVRRKVADRWKDDPYDLASVEAHGDGWMLRRVRKRDAFHLGMRNKDVILSVNGRKLKTQAQLLAAYLALKNKTEFEVVFERKGKQLRHTYKIKG